MSNAHYISILLSLLGVMAMVSAIIFWRMITRMENKIDITENKIDSWFLQHQECRERQQNEFVKVRDFEEWQKSRDLLWRRINRHDHDPGSGKVIITEE